VRAESFFGSYFEKNCHFFQQKTPNKRNKNGTFHHQKRQFWKEKYSFFIVKSANLHLARMAKNQQQPDNQLIAKSR